MLARDGSAPPPARLARPRRGGRRSAGPRRAEQRGPPPRAPPERRPVVASLGRGSRDRARQPGRERAPLLGAPAMRSRSMGAGRRRGISRRPRPRPGARARRGGVCLRAVRAREGRRREHRRYGPRSRHRADACPPLGRAGPRSRNRARRRRRVPRFGSLLRLYQVLTLHSTRRYEPVPRLGSVRIRRHEFATLDSRLRRTLAGGVDRLRLLPGLARLRRPAGDEAGAPAERAWLRSAHGRGRHSPRTTTADDDPGHPSPATAGRRPSSRATTHGGRDDDDGSGRGRNRGRGGGDDD